MVTTYTFGSPAPDGGPEFSVSVVSPRPLPMVEAIALVEAEMGTRPSKVWETELTYPQPQADPRESVQGIAAAYATCNRCHLSARRNMVSTMRGNPYSPVVCVGEGPGREDDERGSPFVGAAGRLQNELFREFDIEPNTLAWMNLVGCRPCNDYWADNRAPLLGELLACSERTWGLLATIRPRVVICLGKEATAVFWDEPPKDVWSWHRVVPDGAPDDWVMVGYARHPTYLARVIGMPSNYKEYAAARTFYGILRAQLASLTKVSAWRVGLRYMHKLVAPMVTK